MLYRYKIKPESPLITPLMSDTFFGHFCWAVRYSRGEDFLNRFLESFGNGNPAPVLFSSAFLSDHIPRPTIPSLSRDRLKKFVTRHFGEDKQDIFQGLSKIKGWSKRKLISVDQWYRLKNDYSEERLYEEYLNEESAVDETAFEFELAASNVISRVSGAVSQEGGLFPREKIWYHEEVDLDLYVETNQAEYGDFVKWFLTDYLSESGFGADKSIGMGRLSISLEESFDAGMFAVQDHNALLSLSLTSFPGIETYDAFYRLITKFGKLGGSFATVSPTGGNPRPFKKPILMYEPGAVFFSTSSLNDRPLLEDVHSDGRIRHCGIPITLPFKIREDQSYAS